MACLASATGVLCSAVSAVAAPASSVSFSKTSTARFHVAPAAIRPLKWRYTKSVIVRANNPESDLQEKVVQSIENAQSVCEGNETSEECVVAWDEAEELAAAVAHKKSQAKVDPLEKYCADNPETDECRTYED